MAWSTNAGGWERAAFAYPLRARFTEFALPALPVPDDIAMVPTVKGTALLRYGEHA